jgi:hypothetical protein
MENLALVPLGNSDLISRPPVWLATTFTTVFGAVAGFFSGLVGQLVIPNVVGQLNMRRVLYRDLAQMLFAVDMVMNMEPSELGALQPDPMLWQQEQFKKFLFFHGEKCCLDNPAIYIQLPERFASQMLYRQLHCILDDPAISLGLNSRKVVRMFAAYVHDGVLRRRRFRRFLGRDKARGLLRIVDDCQRQNEEAMKRLLDQASAQDADDTLG